MQYARPMNLLRSGGALVLVVLTFTQLACLSYGYDPYPYSYSAPRTGRENQIPPEPAPRCVAPTAIFGTNVATDSVGAVPISGGTLTMLADGVTAVASDPDRDLVWVVNLQDQTVSSVAMQPGDEPGRVIESAPGRVHVANRRGGTVTTIDVATLAIQSRESVCPAPRGIAYRAATGSLFVACATGELVTLPAAGGTPTRTMKVGGDLRDVVVNGDQLVISRFRSADVMIVDAAGGVRDLAPPRFVTQSGALFKSSVAWRMIALPDAGVYVSHQYALQAPVTIACGTPGTTGTVETSTYGGTTATGTPTGPIVQSGGSVFGVTTNDVGNGDFSISGGVLPVDVAIADDCSSSAFVAAGSDEVHVRMLFGSCNNPLSGVNQGSRPVPEPVAVAFDKSGRLVVQSREPAMLTIFPRVDTAGAPMTIMLPASTRLHSGQRLFHKDSGKGIACASCHPEALEDGQTWTFRTIQGDVLRRTPALGGGILATAPFHWNGEFQNLAPLMSDVFVNRMGGEPPSLSEIASLGRFLDKVPAAAAPVVSDSNAVSRGRALFEGAAACSTCHSGAKLTNNATVDVGTGGVFQVPSLLGLSARAPYMHTGCAKTLADRFTPECGGGDRHGRTSQLSALERQELIAYLQTL